MVKCRFVRRQREGSAGRCTDAIGRLRGGDAGKHDEQKKEVVSSDAFHCATLNVTLALKMYCVPEPATLEELNPPTYCDELIQLAYEYPLA